jgi:thiol-disulfide isomerase/thioredoxin
MRMPLLQFSFLVVPLCMSGCAQNWTIRKPPGEEVRTVASVGDNLMPIRSGTPDSSVRAQDTEPIIPTPSRGRISGRVYDERGKPLSGAKVRLAVGGEAGGPAVSALTDQSGAFTLRGVRPGSTYTVIAEYEGENERLFGRVDAEAPGSELRISLRQRTEEGDASASSIRPARPHVAPVSNLEEADEPSPSNSSSTRANHEDLDPLAPEAEALRERTGPGGLAPRMSATTGASAKNFGWAIAGSRSAGGTAAEQGGENRSNAESSSAASPRSRRNSIEAASEDDEVNPLPPALDPNEVESHSGATEAPDRSTALAQRTVDSRGQGGRTRHTGPLGARIPAADSRLEDRFSRLDSSPPRPLPPGVLTGAGSVEPEGYAPLSLSDPDSESTKQAGPARLGARDANDPSASLPRRPSPALPASEQSPPTWGELAFRNESIPLDESLRKASRERAGEPAQGSMARPATLQATQSKSASNTPASLGPLSDTEVRCQFNHDEQRLLDFQLPDVGGRMVSFRDYDADLILLDFWGTWCAPCRLSVAHLIKIQQTLGGKRIQVVGIACERSPVKDRSAIVAKAVRDQKINYPILLSNMNEVCPVREAFGIQVYPTLVLLSRDGRILWRERGATDTTLARMDRFILKNLNKTSSKPHDAFQASLSRQGER